MAQQSTRKPSTFLIFPWGLLSIVLILILNLALSDKLVWQQLELDHPGADHSRSHF